jgi:putative FmdB family regulatory protein
MPRYDYRCLNCEKEFTATMSVKEHDEKKVNCPACGSEKVEQRWSPFYAITSKKS